MRCSMSRDTKASASIAAHNLAASTAAPSWLTRAACSARRAASAGSPAATIAQPSMKICAPICSATVRPLTSIEPLAGASIAALQVEPGGVLGRVAGAAPPQDGAILDDVVEPGLADLARRDVGLGAMLLERANEGEGSGDVVVGDDERAFEPVVDVIFDRSELANDAPVGPVLERPAEIDADQLAEHGGVGAFGIVGRQASHGDARPR